MRLYAEQCAEINVKTCYKYSLLMYTLISLILILM